MEKWFLLRSTEHAGEVLLTPLYGISLSTAKHISSRSFTQTQQHVLQPLGFRGWLASTKLRMSSCSSVVSSLLGISCIWHSEKQDAERRDGLKVKWNTYASLMLTELEVVVLWFYDPSPKSSYIWPDLSNAAWELDLLHVGETRLLKSSSFWKHSWSLFLLKLHLILNSVVILSVLSQCFGAA